jgi:hypothetical protein
MASRTALGVSDTVAQPRIQNIDEAQLFRELGGGVTGVSRSTPDLVFGLTAADVNLTCIQR